MERGVWSTTKEFYRVLRAYNVDPSAPKYAVLEMNQGCNRGCSYCDVPNQYNPQRELTLAQTGQALDFIRGQGYLYVTFLGGEPFAPFKTKEGISFADHTLESLRYAKSQGMLVNITSNGDFLTPSRISEAAEAGLDTLVLSLHSYTEPAINHLIKVGQEAAHQRIVPAVHMVMTSGNSDQIPEIAARAARQGVLTSVGLVQTIGDGYAREQDCSVIPTPEQQKKTMDYLKAIKRFGFVRTNYNYLDKAEKYYPNNWKCNAEVDPFIRIAAGGGMNVCPRVGTDLSVFDLQDLKDQRWREQKRAGVADCGNCYFSGYFEVENPHLRGDIPMFALAYIIRVGGASAVEKLGKLATTFLRSKPQVLTVITKI